MSSVLFLVHPDRPAAKELAAEGRAWWEAHGYDVVDAGDASPDRRRLPAIGLTSPSASAETAPCSEP